MDTEGVAGETYSADA